MNSSSPMARAGVSFIPSQLDAPLTTRSLITSSSPLDRLVSDVLLFFQNIGYLLGIVIPLTPFSSGPLDELYPSFANLWAILVHLVLIGIQIAYILSIFLAPFLFGAVFLFYSAVAFALIYITAYLLNHASSGAILHSDSSILDGHVRHDGEVWIFVNGVAVGKHWMQSNLDRLSVTFRRPIIGVHNPTLGIVFDVIQCLIQRDFAYDTPDVRQTYTYLKHALLAPDIHKVVLLAHSQGGIIASMALDWLYGELPSSALQKLEVYTFGCAANHFNNPVRSSTDDGSQASASADGSVHPESPLSASVGAALSSSSTALSEPRARAVPHIEHYAHAGDLVSRWGVLHFATSAQHATNRFAGRVFARHSARGHMLNQHYLDGMFPLDPATGAVAEHSAFADARCAVSEAAAVAREQLAADQIDVVVGARPDAGEKVLRARYLDAVRAHVGEVKGMRVRDLSRLWLYRNGHVPGRGAADAR